MKIKKHILVISVVLITLLTSLFTSCGVIEKISEPENNCVNENTISSPIQYYRTQNNTSIMGVYGSADCILEELPYLISEMNTEEYNYLEENRFLEVLTSPLSTFSIDVDTASYSNTRRFLQDNSLPPIDAVRIEEMINYFSYDFPYETIGDEPFSVYTELGVCPWNKDNYLAMIGIKAEEIIEEETPSSNLVFLLDVSGSMNSPDKLPLLKSAFSMLIDKLSVKDTISIVVYAGASGVILEGAEGADKEVILDALNKLQAGGSTAGAAGIELAYSLANKYFIIGGNNRVILATDGDFNVGISSEGELTRLIEEKRDDGIFLSVLGFGTGNIKDNKMESLADKGNGNYAYIDGITEAKKVLVNEMGSTLYTVAKDVKIQVEFNPNWVSSYKLVGYENRKLNDEDFIDDTKDAGEIGAGHSIIAFYEIVPSTNVTLIDNDLKYQSISIDNNPEIADEWLEISLRYKEPNEDTSKLLIKTVTSEYLLDSPSTYFGFGASVAEFSLLLKNSIYKANASYENVIANAQKYKGEDIEGYRSQFIDLVRIARDLSLYK